MIELIEKKKRGQALSDAEISYIVRGAADGSIPDYQLAAFLMAVCFTGMTDGETACFTACMAQNDADRLPAGRRGGLRRAGGEAVRTRAGLYRRYDR